MRYFIRLQYNGARYHGWQTQPNAMTVQQCIEEALSTLLRTPTTITGAGRTDAGVNARMMIAHFDSEMPIADTNDIIKRLNGILQSDIAIQAIFPVHDQAHARFDATSRTYKYFVAQERMPFRSHFSWYCSRKLDFSIMNEATATLLTVSDFTSFSKLHTDTLTNICHVSDAKWERWNDLWVFTITADRFLRNMVRAIVGTLIDVGTHRISLDQFSSIVEAKNRCSAGTSMPANALFLWNITYPYPIL